MTDVRENYGRHKFTVMTMTFSQRFWRENLTSDWREILQVYKLYGESTENDVNVNTDGVRIVWVILRVDPKWVD